MSDEGEFKSLAEADAFEALMEGKRQKEKAMSDIDATSSDQTTEQLAADYKARAIAIVDAALELFRAADRNQFQIDFHILRDPQGQHYAVGPFVIKRY